PRRIPVELNDAPHAGGRAERRETAERRPQPVSSSRPHHRREHPRFHGPPSVETGREPRRPWVSGHGDHEERPEEPRLRAASPRSTARIPPTAHTPRTGRVRPRVRLFPGDGDHPCPPDGR